MRYKALPGNRFDHQRRKVISDFPRLADADVSFDSAVPFRVDSGQDLRLKESKTCKFVGWSFIVVFTGSHPQVSPRGSI